MCHKELAEDSVYLIVWSSKEIYCGSLFPQYRTSVCYKMMGISWLMRNLNFYCNYCAQLSQSVDWACGLREQDNKSEE
jgi:hypothetical protein